MIQIYHNPRCSKSRECVAHFEDTEQDIQIINYLKNPPSSEEIRELLLKLKMEPIDLVRKEEKVWKEEFSSKQLDNDDIINAMALNPILIQRPIVIVNDKAVIARPLENIKSLI